jgi:imidazolonepropionase-like amidohydrolase
MIEMVRAAHEAGVNIAFGTDSGVSRHGQNAREFALLVEAGLTEMEALVSATVTAAEVLGLSDELGTLAPGMRADVIATPGNPLEDIDAMMDVSFVMKDGLVYKDEGSMLRATLAPRG